MELECPESPTTGEKTGVSREITNHRQIKWPTFSDLNMYFRPIQEYFVIGLSGNYVYGAINSTTEHREVNTRIMISFALKWKL